MIEVEELCRTYSLSFIDREGIYPVPGAVLGENGKMSLMALAAKPEAIVDMAFKMCRDTAVNEFFFSLDCHNRPERQGQYHSVLIVFYVRKEGGGGAIVRLGAMEYGWDEVKAEATVMPLCWDEPFWAAKYGDLLSRLERQCSRRRGGTMVWGRPWERRTVVLN